MLYDVNSNALEGGGGYHPSVRMVLDRGGGVSGPPKKCYILFECSPTLFIFLSKLYIDHL